MGMMSQVFFGNTVTDYVIFLVVVIIGALLMRGIGSLILNRLEKWAAKTSTTIDDMIVSLLRKAVYPFAYFVIVYVALYTLNLSEHFENFMNYVLMAAIIAVVTRGALVVIRHGLDQAEKRQKHSVAVQRSFKAIFSVIRLIVWGVALIFFLDNIGMNISAFVAGLGIGGIAIAFAAQSVLKDLFCYFGIIMDQPFVAGDFIVVGDLKGTVTHVGIVSTRVTSNNGEQLVFSNSDLIASRIKNFKRMERRRVEFKLGVVYQTPLETLKKIPEMISVIVKSQKGVTFDRCHFYEYGDSSLNIETAYFVESSEYKDYRDIHQQILFLIMAEFQKHKIEFAYPTQTVYEYKV